MKTRGTRRRKALRWSVYAGTAILLAAIPVSIWVEPTVVINGPTNRIGGPHRELEMNLSRARFMIMYHGSASWSTSFTASPVSGSSIEYYRQRNLFPPMQSRWWERPMFSQSGGTNGPGTRIELPLVYPAILMLIWSVLLFRANRRKHRPDHCPSCNYNLTGLVHPTCPECGNERTP